MDKFEGEFPKDSEIFRGYPDKQEAERLGGFTFYYLGGEYIGAGKVSLVRKNLTEGKLIAYDSNSEVIFRGGFSYSQGFAEFGALSSFQRAREHKGHRIGRKMMIVGLAVLRDFVTSGQLPLKKIYLETSSGTSMAKIAEYIGMVPGHDYGNNYYRYEMSSLPDIKKLMDELGIEEL